MSFNKRLRILLNYFSQISLFPIFWCSIYWSYSIPLSRRNIAEVDNLLAYHNTLLIYKVGPTDKFMYHIHKDFSLYHHSLGLVVGYNLNGSVEVIHVHRKDFLGLVIWFDLIKHVCRKTHGHIVKLKKNSEDILCCSIFL